MKLHRNARLSVKGRELLVDRVENAGWSLTEAAEAAGVSDRTARKWLARYRAEGPNGLLDRSSAPCVVANRTDEHRVEVIAALRRLRMTGPEIAECLGMAVSTVSGILTRIGLGKLGRLGLEPAPRYERARPGELIHVDVKKLGRIQRGAGKYWRTEPRQHPRPTRTDAAGIRRRQFGWEFVHVAIDDATRLAYVEVLDDEKATTAIAFIRSPQRAEQPARVLHLEGPGEPNQRRLQRMPSAWSSAHTALTSSPRRAAPGGRKQRV
jgi:transposase